ncbi:MAG TPA: enoyl-CoA hydratase/isomerase family protein [Chondromyces sp.]|nr:enoyl-CoA hydratase/isomerase family protein [Chondromyces sp.]
MLGKSVLLEIEDAIAKITLNEPEHLNSFSSTITKGLEDALSKVELDRNIRSVIITGNGKGFCVGGNIKEFPQNQNAYEVKQWMKAASSLALKINRIDKPIIAAVNGFAMGAGFSLALAADIIIASEEASFGMVFNKIGAVPDMGAHFYLPRIVGLQKAKYLMFRAKKITAQEAKDLGIVLEVVSLNELNKRAEEVAREFSESALPALGLSKAILNRSFDLTIEQILLEEGMSQGLAFSTAEHQEGIQAFLEKRKPQFQDY